MLKRATQRVRWSCKRSMPRLSETAESATHHHGIESNHIRRNAGRPLREGQSKAG
jgi:hypothetical protein